MWIARVPHRTVLAVTGVDASKFLSGLVSASIPSVAAPFYTAFIQAQGRVLYDAFVHPHPIDPTGFLVEYDGRESPAPPLHALLKRFVLRSKVRVMDAGEEWDVWQAWGHGTRTSDLSHTWHWARSGVIEPKWPTNSTPWSNSRPCSLVDRRAPGMGLRMLVKRGDRPPETASHDTVDSSEYTYHRLLNGIPEGVVDIVPMQAFPMESNMDVMGGVDFRKGCYVGQELTVRTYHTGVLRKRILPVRLCIPSDASLSPGLDIRLTAPAKLSTVGEVLPRPRATGKLLTSMRGIGLALLRIEHLDAIERGDLTLQVSTSDEISFDVHPWWPQWFPREEGGLNDE